ncbi:MAG: hypothetical protein IKB35_01535 [Clostridia bacterium]|nr:hypothetical protein [Clostridia bacterium]
MLDVKKIASVEEGVIKLLTIRELPVPDFSVERACKGEYTHILRIGEERIPLLYHRYEPRINALHGYGRSTLENCCLNTYSFVGSDVSLEELLWRELDLAEYILGSKIVKITAFVNGGACNLIAKTALGTLANLELGNTMASGTIPQFSHRLITKHGMASDRTVNNMVEQNGIYLFGNNDTRPLTFDEGDYYLFGLSESESTEVSYIYGIIKGAVDRQELISQNKRLKGLVKAAFESSRLGKSVFVSEEEL